MVGNHILRMPPVIFERFAVTFIIEESESNSHIPPALTMIRPTRKLRSLVPLPSFEPGSYSYYDKPFSGIKHGNSGRRVLNPGRLREDQLSYPTSRQ